MSFQLSVSGDACGVDRVVALAAIVGVTLSVEKTEGDGVCCGGSLSLNGDAKACGLNSILKAIASVKPELLGQDAVAVEKTLILVKEKIDVPSAVLCRIANDSSVTNSSEYVALYNSSRSDIAAAFKALEAALTETTFVAGHFVTVADISAADAVTTAVEKSYVKLQSTPAVARWLRSMAVRPLAAAEALSARVAAVVSSAPVTGASTTGKWSRHRIRVKELLAGGVTMIGKTIVAKGWIRTTRSAERGAVLFVELTDGSCPRGIQLVLHAERTEGFADVAAAGGAGASLNIIAKVTSSPAAGQAIELSVISASVLGTSGESNGRLYPLAKKAHSLEFLRSQAHLRPRSKLFGATIRVRHAMALATHRFFHERSFNYVHTPLITGADCEGAGEQFAVTTLLPEGVRVADIPADPKTGLVNFNSDFFGRRTCLTVSGQLNVETHACALGDVYTFGPTFRAEQSHTARHLAEFWMIEPEIAFADLVDDIALAEDYVKFCARVALEECADDLHYLENEYPAGEKGLAARLRNVVESDFARITYTEAVRLLQEAIASGTAQFLVYPEWGDDLGSEHERFLTERIFQRPTVVINYPKDIKAFYMKLNPDGKTVAAMDVLVPKIGELIGGSQREDNLEILEARCTACGLDPASIWWYSDLRRYGTIPHAGFGLGFERLVMFVTGLENIRDVISFPRVPGHADF